MGGRRFEPLAWRTRSMGGRPISRRTWLATMAAAFARPTTAAWCQSPKKEKTPLTAADREADATVRDKAKKGRARRIQHPVDRSLPGRRRWPGRLLHAGA